MEGSSSVEPVTILHREICAAPETSALPPPKFRPWITMRSRAREQETSKQTLQTSRANGALPQGK